jgi:hypothetical protein
MKKALLLAGALLALTATVAAAQGIDLSLNDCGLAGALNAPVNPCNSNTGLALAMVGSVMPPPAGVPHMIGMEAVLDGQTSQPVLSPWWDLGGCRAAAFTAPSGDFTAGPFNCADYWAGQALTVGGIDPTHSQPNRFRIKLAFALPGLESPMAGGSEYYMFKVNITKTKTTGTGSCGGCSDACSIVLNEIKLVEPTGVGDFRIFNPLYGQIIGYNGGIANGLGVTPTANRTWGQVKALYR